MLRSTFIFLFILYLSGKSGAQIGYHRMYNNYGGWDNFVRLVDYDSSGGSLKLIGYSIDFLGTEADSSYYGFPYLLKLNSDGNKELLKGYSKPGYYFDGVGGNSRFLEDGTYLLNYTMMDTAFNFEQWLFIIDTASFDTVKTIKVGLPSPKHGVRQVSYKNGFEYREGSLYLTSRSDFCPFFLVTDTNGIKRAYKTFPDNKNGYFYNFLFTESNRIFFAGVYSYDINGSRIATWYGLMDTVGEMIWEKKIENPLIPLNYKGVFATALNNRYYLYGSDQEGLNSFKTIAEIDINNGNIIWKRNIFDLGETGSLEIFDKKSYDNGLYITGDYSVGDQQFGLLAKLDSEGNILWKRLFQEASFENRLWSLNFVKNGILLFGDARDSTNTLKSNGWIIKADTFGCIVPGCNLNDGIPQIIGEGIYFTAFPNPASTRLNIRYSYSNMNAHYKLRVIDMNGRTIFEKMLSSMLNETNIETEYWANGLYLVQLSLQDKIKATTKIQVLH